MNKDVTLLSIILIISMACSTSEESVARRSQENPIGLPGENNIESVVDEGQRGHESSDDGDQASAGESSAGQTNHSDQEEHIELLKTSINSLVSPHIDETAQNSKKVVSAVIGVVKQGIAEVFAFGKTHASGAAPTGDTFYTIASVSKAFAGLALSRLVAEGKVSLEGKVADSLPGMLADEFDQQMTFRELVTHTSGLKAYAENYRAFRDVDRDGQGDSTDWAPGRNYELQHFLACLQGGGCAPVAENRGKYLYSNMGIGILGVAIAKASGHRTFDEALKGLITKPLTMNDTGTNTADFIARVKENYAPAHSLTQGGQFEQVPPLDMGAFSASGEIISTGNDMLKLMNALTGLDAGELSVASQESKAILVDNGKPMGYAYDILKDKDGSDVFAKPGGGKGHKALILWQHDPKVGVFVLVNSGSFAELRQLAFDILAVAKKN